MKTTRWIALLLIVTHGLTIGPAWSAGSASGEELERLLFARLLLDSDHDNARLGARSIAQLTTGATKESLSDLAAEQLIALADPDPNLQPDLADVVGWHVNVLATNPMRYRAVLTEARQRYGHLKVLKRIDLALASPSAAPAEEYKLRNVDLAAMKADTDQQWAANRHRDRSQFAKLQTGSRLDTVLSALGTPDDVTGTTIRVARYGRTQMLTLHYAQTGMVLFKIEGTEKREWGAFEFVDELFDINASYLGQHFGVAQTIAGLRGSRFRDYLMYRGNFIRENPEFLPVLEQRLLSVTQPADDFETDAMVRCVRIIYRYGSLEAMDALRRIDKGSIEKSVQKEARGFATKLELRSTVETESKEAPEEEAVDDDEA